MLNLDLKLETKNIDENSVTVAIDGTVDTQLAEKFGSYIRGIHEQYPNKKIILDFKNVEMITSSCIRHILSFKKENFDFEIINIKKEVFTVFKLTGLSKQLDLEQETLKISVEGRQLLGQGFSSKVYKIDDETIAKIYYNNPDIDTLITERIIAKKAFVKGVPTEISFGMCECDGAPGLIYELVDAKPLLKVLVNDFDNVDKYIPDYVNIVKEFHKYDGYGIPELHDLKENYFECLKTFEDRLSDEENKKMLEIGNSIPDSVMLVHADPHPANLMYTDRGLVFIDLSEMGTGDEIFDLVYLYRTCITFPLAYGGDNHYDLDANQTEELFYKFFDEYYKDKSKEEKEILLKKIIICSYDSILSLFITETFNEKAAAVIIEDLHKKLAEY